MKTSFLFSLLVTIIFTSCSNTSARPSLDQRLTDMGLQLGEGNSRIPRYRVNGWTEVDDRNLIISAGVKDKYLVQLSAPCLGLDGAFNIGFTTPTGRLDRFDNIIVRSLGIGREICSIQDIFQLQAIDDAGGEPLPNEP